MGLADPILYSYFVLKGARENIWNHSELDKRKRNVRGEVLDYK